MQQFRFIFRLYSVFFPNATPKMSDRVISGSIVSHETVWTEQYLYNF
jgi:hypothetical protein